MNNSMYLCIRIRIMTQLLTILLAILLYGGFYTFILYQVNKRIKQKNMKHLCGTAKKKPVKIEFFKWSGWSASNVKELKAWVESFGNKFEDVIGSVVQGQFYVKTLEGSSYDLPDGYVIIRGVEGEFYPCEPNIFDKTYDICTR